MATKTAPVKRGPGRPKKVATTETPKRGPGRPKKVVTEETPVKRGPGRPRKNPESAPVKKGPGRPKKVQEIPATDNIKTPSQPKQNTQLRTNRLERALASADVADVSGLPFQVQQAVITIHRYIRNGDPEAFARVSESLHD